MSRNFIRRRNEIQNKLEILCDIARYYKFDDDPLFYTTVFETILEMYECDAIKGRQCHAGTFAREVRVLIDKMYQTNTKLFVEKFKECGANIAIFCLLPDKVSLSVNILNEKEADLVRGFLPYMTSVERANLFDISYTLLLSLMESKKNYSILYLLVIEMIIDEATWKDLARYAGNNFKHFCSNYTGYNNLDHIDSNSLSNHNNYIDYLNPSEDLDSNNLSENTQCNCQYAWFITDNINFNDYFNDYFSLNYTINNLEKKNKFNQNYYYYNNDGICERIDYKKVYSYKNLYSDPNSYKNLYSNPNSYNNYEIDQKKVYSYNNYEIDQKKVNLSMSFITSNHTTQEERFMNIHVVPEKLYQIISTIMGFLEFHVLSAIKSNLSLEKDLEIIYKLFFVIIDKPDIIFQYKSILFTLLNTSTYHDQAFKIILACIHRFPTSLPFADAFLAHFYDAPFTSLINDTKLILSLISVSHYTQLDKLKSDDIIYGSRILTPLIEKLFNNLERSYFLSHSNNILQKTHALQRIAFILLANKRNFFVDIDNKIITAISILINEDPVVKSELFRLAAIVIFKISHTHIIHLFPIIFAEILKHISIPSTHTFEFLSHMFICIDTWIWMNNDISNIKMLFYDTNFIIRVASLYFNDEEIKNSKNKKKLSEKNSNLNDDLEVKKKITTMDSEAIKHISGHVNKGDNDDYDRDDHHDANINDLEKISVKKKEKNLQNGLQKKLDNDVQLSLERELDSPNYNIDGLSNENVAAVGTKSCLYNNIHYRLYKSGKSFNHNAREYKYYMPLLLFPKSKTDFRHYLLEAASFYKWASDNFLERDEIGYEQYLANTFKPKSSSYEQ